MIRAISQFLYQHYQQTATTTDFWQTKSIEEIVQSQQTQPVDDISALKADFWPEDESADDFIEFVQRQRQEDRLHS